MAIDTDPDWLRRLAPVLCIAGLFVVLALARRVSPGRAESAQAQNGRDRSPVDHHF